MIDKGIYFVEEEFFTECTAVRKLTPTQPSKSPEFRPEIEVRTSWKKETHSRG